MSNCLSIKLMTLEKYSPLPKLKVTFWRNEERKEGKKEGGRSEGRRDRGWEKMGAIKEFRGDKNLPELLH